MGLNVKAALVICGACIGVMSWLLQQAGLPHLELPSPLLAGMASADTARPAGADEWPAVVEDVGSRAGWAQRFERPNAMDRQDDANRAAGTSLAVVGPTDDTPGELPPVALPPLAYAAAGTESLEMPAAISEIKPAGGVEESLVAANTGGGGAEPESAALVLKRYRVVKGDTLTRIARREWKSSDPRLIELLVEVNPQLRSRRNHVLAGEVLSIPDQAAARQALVGGHERARTSPGDEVVARAGSGPASETKNHQWYTIQRNDSLTSIAQRHLGDGRRWRDIAKLNRSLNDPHKIYPGVRIKLPPAIRVVHR